MDTKRADWLPIAMVCAACAASPKINVGGEPDASAGGGGGAAGASGFGGFGGVSGVGGADNTLTAAITEPPSAIAVELITIRCAGECKQVLAVARGGNDPYAFAWSDGVTTAAREICADEDTTLTVTVEDTAIVEGEFPYPGQTATATVMANVLACPADAGVDAGSCGENLSLEGATPGLTESVGWNLPNWSICFGTPDVNPSVTSLAPSDGDTYLAMIGTNDAVAESAGVALCTPLAAGASTSLLIDVAVSWVVAPAVLELWGGAASCGKDELLWTSPVVDDSDVWHTFCATLTPSQALSHLVLWPQPTTLAGAYVLVDNIRPVSACPAP